MKHLRVFTPQIILALLLLMFVIVPLEKSYAHESDNAFSVEVADESGEDSESDIDDSDEDINKERLCRTQGGYFVRGECVFANPKALRLGSTTNDSDLNSASRTDALQQQMEERREERMNNFADRVSDRITRIFEVVYNRMHAAIERLHNIAERLASRITILEEEEGVDLSDSKDLLETANGLIDDAEAKLAEVKADTDETLGQDPLPEDFRDLLLSLREDYATVRDAIKDAHAALVEVVKSIRLGLASVVDDSSESNESEE